MRLSESLGSQRLSQQRRLVLQTISPHVPHGILHRDEVNNLITTDKPTLEMIATRLGLKPELVLDAVDALRHDLWGLPLPAPPPGAAVEVASPARVQQGEVHEPAVPPLTAKRFAEAVAQPFKTSELVELFKRMKYDDRAEALHQAAKHPELHRGSGLDRRGYFNGDQYAALFVELRNAAAELAPLPRLALPDFMGLLALQIKHGMLHEDALATGFCMLDAHDRGHALASSVLLPGAGMYTEMFFELYSAANVAGLPVRVSRADMSAYVEHYAKLGENFGEDLKLGHRDVLKTLFRSLNETDMLDTLKQVRAKGLHVSFLHLVAEVKQERGRAERIGLGALSKEIDESRAQMGAYVGEATAP